VIFFIIFTLFISIFYEGIYILNTMNYLWIIVLLAIIILGVLFSYDSIIEGLENNELTSIKETIPTDTTLAASVNKTTPSDTSVEQEYDIPSYEIQLDEEGKYDPSQFEDYIDEEQITKTTTDDGTAWVKDKDGNMIALKDDGTSWIKDEEGNMVPLNPADKLSNNINYYEPGTYKYGSSSYIPTYEDSILLSKTTGKSTVSEFIDEKSIKSGICTHYKDQPDKLEEECGKLDTNVCSSTDCCVLFGGSKCVAGNAQGPISKLYYGDITIRNRDYYYYKGKCYGNCVK